MDKYMSKRLSHPATAWTIFRLTLDIKLAANANSIVSKNTLFVVPDDATWFWSLFFSWWILNSHKASAEIPQATFVFLTLLPFVAAKFTAVLGAL